MGLGRHKLSAWEAVIIQILCVILVISLPIVWVAILLFGLVGMLRSPSNAIERAKDTASSIATVTAVPFVFTWRMCSRLFGRSDWNDEDENEDVRVHMTGRRVGIQS
jgi:hypothetical protein